MCLPKVIWSSVSLMWSVSTMSASRANGWFLWKAFLSLALGPVLEPIMRSRQCWQDYSTRQTSACDQVHKTQCGELLSGHLQSGFLVQQASTELTLHLLNTSCHSKLNWWLREHRTAFQLTNFNTLLVPGMVGSYLKRPIFTSVCYNYCLRPKAKDLGITQVVVVVVLGFSFVLCLINFHHHATPNFLLIMYPTQWIL